jgi:hypothetical protein
MQKKVPAPGAVPVSTLLIPVVRILVKILSPSALVMIVSRPGPKCGGISTGFAALWTQFRPAE